MNHYVDAWSRVVHYKPLIERMKGEIGKIPENTATRSAAEWYTRRMAGHELYPGLDDFERKITQFVKDQLARANLAFSPGLQTLHFPGRLLTNGLGELGPKYTMIG